MYKEKFSHIYINIFNFPLKKNHIISVNKLTTGGIENGIEVVQITQEECVAEVERVNKIINVTERLKMHGKTN